MACPKEEYAGNTMTCSNNYEDWKYEDIAEQDWNHRIIPKQGHRRYDDLAEQDWKAPCRAQIKILETVTIRYYSEQQQQNWQWTTLTK